MYFQDIILFEMSIIGLVFWYSSMTLTSHSKIRFGALLAKL